MVLDRFSMSDLADMTGKMTGALCGNSIIWNIIKYRFFYKLNNNMISGLGQIDVEEFKSDVRFHAGQAFLAFRGWKLLKINKKHQNK